MSQKMNAGYAITDRLSVGEFEFVIGQREAGPTRFVTWKCRKGEKDYFWGHYLSDRLAAIEDLCKRAIDEVEYLRTLQPQKDIEKQPVHKSGNMRREPER